MLADDVLCIGKDEKADILCVGQMLTRHLTARSSNYVLDNLVSDYIECYNSITIVC